MQNSKLLRLMKNMKTTKLSNLIQNNKTQTLKPNGKKKTKTVSLMQNNKTQTLKSQRNINVLHNFSYQGSIKRVIKTILPSFS